MDSRTAARLDPGVKCGMKYANLISSPAQPAACKIFFKFFRVSSTTGGIKKVIIRGCELPIYAPQTNRDNNY